MQRQYLKKENYHTWDIFVKNSPQTTIYGQTWYLAALQCPFKILVIKENQAIIAGIVLTKNGNNQYANPYLGKYLGIYYAPFLGSAYQQETKRRKATRLLLEELTKLSSFDYFFHPNFTTYLPFYEKEFDNKVRYSYWIDLRQSMATIESQFHGKLRSEIRFAEKQPYQISDTISIVDFVHICQQTFLQKKAKFPFTIPWLTHYCQQLVDRKVIQLIGIKNEQQELMAAAAILLTNDTATLILSGFDKEKIKRGANELLLFSCIKIAKKQAYFFDFEGSMIRPIESFYRKFGGDFRPYLVIYKQTIFQFLYGRLRRWARRLKII